MPRLENAHYLGTRKIFMYYLPQSPHLPAVAMAAQWRLRRQFAHWWGGALATTAWKRLWRQLSTEWRRTGEFDHMATGNSILPLVASRVQQQPLGVVFLPVIVQMLLS